MIRGNTSNFIGHHLPEDSISDPHMGPPTTPGSRAPHHLNPALSQLRSAMQKINQLNSQRRIKNPTPTHGWRNLFQNRGAQVHYKKDIEKFYGLDWQV